MAKAKPGVSAEQRESVNAALRAYGAHLSEDDHIVKGDKVTNVKLAVKGGRLRVESGAGNLLASYPASRIDKGVSDFVESFWFWKKTAATTKSAAELESEIKAVVGS